MAVFGFGMHNLSRGTDFSFMLSQCECGYKRLVNYVANCSLIFLIINVEPGVRDYGTVLFDSFICARERPLSTASSFTCITEAYISVLFHSTRISSVDNIILVPLSPVLQFKARHGHSFTCWPKDTCWWIFFRLLPFCKLSQFYESASRQQKDQACRLATFLATFANSYSCTCSDFVQNLIQKAAAFAYATGVSYNVS